MLAQQLIREGKLAEGLEDLQNAIRKQPQDAKLRIFLFQILTVTGQWPRALSQLKVIGEMDPTAVPMVKAYREAIQCEALRHEIFAGKRAPLVFGEPAPWLVLLLQALKSAGEGDEQAALRAREQGLESAPATAGTINGEAFEWIADADCRLGPVLEVLLNGRYYWVPFDRIRKIELEAPADLRDAVWMPASFTWATGGETVGFIPTRYSETLERTESGLLLSRETQWVGENPLLGHGLGQRMFGTNAGEYPLMDVRSIELESVTAPTTDG